MKLRDPVSPARPRRVGARLAVPVLAVWAIADCWQQPYHLFKNRRKDSAMMMTEKVTENQFPENEKQVRMFGAKLDASMAGRRAVRHSHTRLSVCLAPVAQVSRAEILAVLADEDDSSEVSTEQRAEIFYAEAVERMNKANYNRAVELLNRACYYASPTSRRGGQMQLWLAQALYAAGERPQCIRLLEVLKKHPDRDVRMVSKELAFIVQAPELVLNSSSYITINMDNFDDDSVYQRAPDGTISKRSQISKLREEPEYGSVEWAIAQAALEKPLAQFDPALAIAATVLCLGLLAFFRQPAP